MDDLEDPGRRALVKAVLAVPVAGLVGWSRAESNSLEPTPACGDGDEPTPALTAGPFFKPDSPRRASLLEPGLAGTPLVVSGLVLSTACAPVPGALLDFWHSDDSGEYDLDGFRLRGHHFADGAGRFRLETIVPGGYGGRTRHIHVRVQAPHGRVLTTQLYFPGEARNTRDGLFTPRLLMEMAPAVAGRRAGTFNFVLRT